MLWSTLAYHFISNDDVFATQVGDSEIGRRFESLSGSVFGATASICNTSEVERTPKEHLLSAGYISKARKSKVFSKNFGQKFCAGP
jgi:hypothetical protein